MVRYLLEEQATSTLQMYNRLRVITREFLLSQVSGTMLAPRKTAGRMKPQVEETRPKPAVCRRLFADDDPADQGLRDNMFNQLTEQIGRSLDDACKKYNFDFRNEVPLEGDWTWERIAPEGDASVARAEPPAAAPDTAGHSEGSTGKPAQSSADPRAPLADPLQPPTVPQ